MMTDSGRLPLTPAVSPLSMSLRNTVAPLPSLTWIQDCPLVRKATMPLPLLPAVTGTCPTVIGMELRAGCGAPGAAAVPACAAAVAGVATVPAAGSGTCVSAAAVGTAPDADAGSRGAPTDGAVAVSTATGLEGTVAAAPGGGITGSPRFAWLTASMPLCT